MKRLLHIPSNTLLPYVFYTDDEGRSVIRKLNKLYRKFLHVCIAHTPAQYARGLIQDLLESSGTAVCSPYRAFAKVFDFRMLYEFYWDLSSATPRLRAVTRRPSNLNMFDAINIYRTIYSTALLDCAANGTLHQLSLSPSEFVILNG